MTLQHYALDRLAAHHRSSTGVMRIVQGLDERARVVLAFTNCAAIACVHRLSRFGLRFAFPFIGERIFQRIRPAAILRLQSFHFLVGKIFGARLVFVESLTRTASLSLSGRMVRPLADAFFVQWPDLAAALGVRFAGRLL